MDGEREREKSENELMGDYREGEIKGEKRVFKMKKKKKKKKEKDEGSTRFDVLTGFGYS